MALTTQQQMILTQTRGLFESTERTGEYIDTSGLRAVVVSSALSILVALSLLAVEVNLAFLLGALGFSIACTILISAFSAFLLMPVKHELPGIADWDNAFDIYISVEVDDAYNQILKNLIDATLTNQAQNAKAARLVKVATWLMFVQCVGVLVLLVLTAYGAR